MQVLANLMEPQQLRDLRYAFSPTPWGTPLTEEKQMKIVQAMVQDRGYQTGIIDIHEPRKDGKTILYSTVGGGFVSPVRYLIEHGGGDPTEPKICPWCWQKKCPVHSTPRSYKCGPLISAVVRGHLEIVKYLISIAPNIAVDEDFGCVSSAAKEGYLEIVRCLLEAGGDKNSLDAIRGNPAITNAISFGHTDVVSLLIARGKHLPYISSMCCPFISWCYISLLNPLNIYVTLP